MTGIQIILILFALFAAFKAVKRYRAHDLTAPVLGGWIIFWALVIVVALWPNSTAQAAKLLGLGRGADLIIYVSLALLFFLYFRLMVRVEKINRDLTRVTRELALGQESNHRLSGIPPYGGDKSKNQEINHTDN